MSQIEPDQDDRDHVYRFAVSVCRDRWLADDLTQEAILRAVRMERPFGNRIDLRKWLFRVTLNLWIDKTRKISAATNCALQLRDLVDVRECPNRRAELTEEMEVAFVAMQRLPPKQRQVLHLRVVEGMGVKDVAETLGITRGAVKTNLSLARKALRKAAYPSEKTTLNRSENE